MTKLTLLAVLGLMYIGVVRLANFFMAVFIILFFGAATWGLIRTARQQAKDRFASQLQSRSITS
jgi:hypothetical protein